MNPTEELFAIAAVWTLLAVGVSMLFKTWRNRAAFVFVMVAIPFWELPFGYYTFRKLCNESAVARIQAKFEPQSSICVDELDSLHFANLARAGFKKIEVTGKVLGALPEHSATSVEMSSADATSSEFCVELVANTGLNWRMVRHDLQIVRSKGRQIVARQSAIDWRGMSWQEYFAPLLGRGGQCVGDPIALYQVLRNGNR